MGDPNDGVCRDEAAADIRPCTGDAAREGSRGGLVEALALSYAGAKVCQPASGVDGDVCWGAEGAADLLSGELEGLGVGEEVVDDSRESCGGGFGTGED